MCKEHIIFYWKVRGGHLKILSVKRVNARTTCLQSKFLNVDRTPMLINDHALFSRALFNATITPQSQIVIGFFSQNKGETNERKQSLRN